MDIKKVLLARSLRGSLTTPACQISKKRGSDLVQMLVKTDNGCSDRFYKLQTLCKLLCKLKDWVTAEDKEAATGGVL